MIKGSIRVALLALLLLLLFACSSEQDSYSVQNSYRLEDARKDSLRFYGYSAEKADMLLSTPFSAANNEDCRKRYSKELGWIKFVQSAARESHLPGIYGMYGFSRNDEGRVFYKVKPEQKPEQLEYWERELQERPEYLTSSINSFINTTRDELQVLVGYFIAVADFEQCLRMSSLTLDEQELKDKMDVFNKLSGVIQQSIYAYETLKGFGRPEANEFLARAKFYSSMELSKHLAESSMLNVNHEAIEAYRQYLQQHADSLGEF